MSLNWARPGLGAVGEYQASGTPLVLSAGTHSLKFYSRAIVVLPNATLKIHDGSNTQSSTITAPSESAIRLEIRCKKITVTGSPGVVVELTNIHHDAGELPEFSDLTL